MSVHRTLAGAWAECPGPEVCELLFHLPELSVVEAEALPMVSLLPLFEAVQPPSAIAMHGGEVQKLWYDSNEDVHRDYDLPAIVSSDEYYWCQRGYAHRDGDLPAIVSPSSRVWYQHGLEHREGGKPAVVHSNGQVEYWQQGKRVEPATELEAEKRS